MYSCDPEQGSYIQKESKRDQSTGQMKFASAYRDNVVTPKLQHKPWLESLFQFMDPNAAGFAVDLCRRMTHFDIKVLHFDISGKSQPIIHCSSSHDLASAMRKHKDHAGTLLIAKDISQEMIEALGMTFELEPELFASHLAGTELYRTGRRQSPTLQAPARAPTLLPNYTRNAPFYTAEYRRPYYIEGVSDIIKLRSAQTCTPRGALLVHDDLPDVFVSEKISVYKRKGSNIGIILTDHLLSDAPPSSHIPSPVATLDEDVGNLGVRGRWCQVSSQQELVSWFHNLAPDKVKTIFNDDEQLALLPILKIVESNGVMFLAHARFIMDRVLSSHCDSQFPNNIPFFLHISRSLYRCIYENQKVLRHARRLAYISEDISLRNQEQDFGFLADDSDGMLKALEEDVRFLVGEASIQEGRIVGWVSKFAALFLPVSLLATILSISSPGYTRWVILGALSVPFVLVLIYLMFFWKPAHFNGLRS